MEQFTTITIKRELHEKLSQLKTQSGFPITSLIRMSIPFLEKQIKKQKSSSILTEKKSKVSK